LSVAAAQVRSTRFAAAPVAITFCGTVGAVVSGPGVAAAANDWADSLPAASIALTVYVYAVPDVRPVSLRLVEPIGPMLDA